MGCGEVLQVGTGMTHKVKEGFFSQGEKKLSQLSCKQMNEVPKVAGWVSSKACRRIIFMP